MNAGLLASILFAVLCLWYANHALSRYHRCGGSPTVKASTADFEVLGRISSALERIAASMEKKT